MKRPKVRRLVERRMCDPDALFVVAERGESVIGIGHQLPARDVDGEGAPISGLMHLSMIAVDPNYWGQGIGRMITEHCVARAREVGYQSVQLWTHVTNERARWLYASVGFTDGGREKSDEFGERIRLYVLSLND